MTALSIRRRLLPVIVLAALPVVLLLPALLPGRDLLPAAMLGNMVPWRGAAPFAQPSPFNPLQFDGIAQFYPWRLFAAQTWRSGFVPLWNPYQFCGTPFLANDQSAVLYPFNLLFLILPTAKAFGASAVLHLWMTGLFLYAWMRRRGLGRAGALLAGVIWQLSAWQVAWLALPTFLCTSAWMPLALLSIDRCAEEPADRSRSLALGAVIGMMLLAGHLQIAFYGVLVCAAYGLARLWRERSRRGALSAAFLSAAAVAGLLCAAQILPTLELSRVSHRAGALPSAGGYHAYVSLAMPAYHLVTLLAPSFFGRSLDYWGATNYAENACYVGIAGLLLAFLAATRLWREEFHVRFLCVTALVVVLIALGSPLNALPYFGIPGFGQTGSPARILCLWTLCAACLAGYGLDALLSGRCPKAAIWWTIGALAAALVGAVAWIGAAAPTALSRVSPLEIGTSGGLLVAAITLVVLIHHGKITPRAGGALVIALVAAELMRAGFGYNLAADDAQVYPVTPALSFLRQNLGSERVLVINARNGVYEAPGVLPPNSATVFGLRDLQGYDSLQTGQFKNYLAQVDGGIDSSPRENGNMDLTHFEALQNHAALPPGIRYVASPVPIEGLGSALTTDPSLYVYSAPRNAPSRAVAEQGGAGSPPVPLLVRDTAPSRVAIDGAMPGAQVALYDQWYPGWSARAGIERSGVFRLARAGAKPGATSTMRYQPASFRVGFYLSCVGVAWLCAGIGAAALRPWKKLMETVAD